MPSGHLRHLNADLLARRAEERLSCANFLLGAGDAREEVSLLVRTEQVKFAGL